MSLAVLLHDEAVAYAIKDSRVVLANPKTKHPYSTRPYHENKFGVLHAIVKRRVGSQFILEDDELNPGGISIPLLLRYTHHIVLIDAMRNAYGNWSWDRKNARCFEMSEEKILDLRWGHFFPESHIALTDNANLLVNPLPPSVGERFSNHPLATQVYQVSSPEDKTKTKPILACFDYHPRVFTIATHDILYTYDTRANTGTGWISDKFANDPICVLEKCTTPTHGLISVHEDTVRLWDARKANMPISSLEHLMAGVPLGCDVNKRTLVAWTHQHGDIIACELRAPYSLPTFFEFCSSAKARALKAASRADSEAESSKEDNNQESKQNNGEDKKNKKNKKDKTSKSSGSDDSNSGEDSSNQDSSSSDDDDSSDASDNDSIASGSSGMQSAAEAADTSLQPNSQRFAVLEKYLDPDDATRSFLFRRYVGKKRMLQVKSRHPTIGGYLTPRGRLMTMDVYGERNKFKMNVDITQHKIEQHQLKQVPDDL